MQTILQQFQQVDTNAEAFEANFHLRALQRLQRAYTTLLAEYEALWQAEAEGIVEITLRSRTQTLIVPVQPKVSAQLAMHLGEMLGDQLHDVQQRIIREHEDLVNEGELPARQRLLELLLTPADAQGLPVVPFPPQSQPTAA